MGIAERIIVALDVDSGDRALYFVRELMPDANYFKIGSQLFTACGPTFVREVIQEGARVFLDLKFHDIPQTVAKAVVEAARLEVDMINVHASGGLAMLQAARVALDGEIPKSRRPQLIAVTMLTSIGEVDAREIGFSLPLANQSVRLAQLAQRAELDGVVASPLEIGPIRQACGPGFLIVTPAIRPVRAELHDHVRIATPSAALKAGADYVVIGRPILEASRPLDAFRQIVRSVEQDA
jgi:orotidine-5'-phosphate decarboxylase